MASGDGRQQGPGVQPLDLPRKDAHLLPKTLGTSPIPMSTVASGKPQQAAVRRGARLAG
jgi:hypothetical protein